MKHTDRGWLRGRFVGSALVLAALAACGGGDGDQSPKFQPSRIVSFGDSLSDVGSYNTTGLVAGVNEADTTTGTTNSGKFTVNSAGAKNWIELIAAAYGVDAPCSAQTGLNSVSSLAGLAAATVNHPTCYAYGQGGSRVTLAVGPGNVGTLPAPSGALGQLTKPLTDQVSRHLAKGNGAFASDELVLVLAGGNDLFINGAVIEATAQASGDVATAINNAVIAMGTAGVELAALVKTQMLAKGAKHVVVVNLPDVSLTPDSIDKGASSQAITKTMTTTFNTALSNGLKDAGSAVVFVDAFTQSVDQAAHPAQYGLSNVTKRACDVTKLVVDLVINGAPNAATSATLGTSLVCNSKTLIAGDTSTYQYADGVHPTPYGYKLLAQFVTDRLAKAGLL
jgi:phospholipase/lecithinase/hemolysin